MPTTTKYTKTVFPTSIPYVFIFSLKDTPSTFFFTAHQHHQ